MSLSKLENYVFISLAQISDRYRADSYHGEAMFAALFPSARCVVSDSKDTDSVSIFRLL